MPEHQPSCIETGEKLHVVWSLTCALRDSQGERASRKGGLKAGWVGREQVRDSVDLKEPVLHRDSMLRQHCESFRVGYSV
jgi:hypothetical protein